MNSREEIYNASPKIPPAWETTGAGRSQAAGEERGTCAGAEPGQAGPSSFQGPL